MVFSSAPAVSVALLASLLWPGDALACAACGCGDPTLTTMGAEKPYAGRMRLALEVSHLTLELGRPETGGLELSEQRFDGIVAYAPSTDLFLSLRQPVVRRGADYANGASDTVTHLGDTDLRAKYFVFADRDFAARHLVAVVTGARLPTAPLQTGEGGQALPSELQTGGGTVEAQAGLAYAAFPRPLSFSFIAVAGAPMLSRFDFLPAPSLRSSAGVQWQPVPAFAVRADVDARLEDVEREKGGGIEDDTGGFIAFASPGVVLTPVTDLVLSCIVRLPFVQAFRGTREEGPIIQGAIAYDLF